MVDNRRATADPVDDNSDDPLLLVPSKPRPSKRRRVERSPSPTENKTPCPDNDDVVETSDPDEMDVLTPFPLPASYFIPFPSSLPPASPKNANLSQLEVDNEGSSSLSPPPTPTPSASIYHVSHVLVPPEPQVVFQAPKRELRRRHLIQLNPYTIESHQYRLLMKARGQKDAIVPQKELEREHRIGRESPDTQENEWTPPPDESTEKGHRGPADMPPVSPASEVETDIPRRRRPFPMRLPRIDREATILGSTLKNQASSRNPMHRIVLGKIPASSVPSSLTTAFGPPLSHFSTVQDLDDIGVDPHAEDFDRTTNNSIIDLTSSPEIPHREHNGHIDVSSSEDDPSSIQSDSDPVIKKKKRILSRVMPAFMAKRLEQQAKGGQRSLPRRTATSEAESSESELDRPISPPRPGVAKVTLAHRPHSGPIVIQGDPESSDGEESSSDSSSNGSSLYHTTDNEQDLFSDFVSGTNDRPNTLPWLDVPHEGDLIDRMLSRTRRHVESKKRIAHSKRRQNVSLHNDGPSRSSVLDRSDGTPPHPEKADTSALASKFNQQRFAVVKKKKSLRRPPMNVYIFERNRTAKQADLREYFPRGPQIQEEATSVIFRPKTTKVSNTDSQSRLPLAKHRSDTTKSWRRRAKHRRPHVASAVAAALAGAARTGAPNEEPTHSILAGDPPEANLRFSLDFHIPVLDGTMPRIDSPYIGQTRLAQLLKVPHQPPERATPWLYDHFGVNLALCHTLTALRAEFPSLTSRLFDWATGVIQEDNDDTRACQLIVCSSQLVSWLLSGLSPDVDDAKEFVDFFIEHCLHLVTKMRKWTCSNRERDKFLGYRGVWLNWFVVEITFRIRCGVPTPHMHSIIGERLNEFLDSLVVRLLDIGMEGVIECLRVYHTSAAIENHVIDVWIGIIHLTNTAGPISECSGTFWDRINRCIDSQIFPPKSKLELCEHIWRIVFTVNTLSQFTPIGTLSSRRNLSSFWPLVSRAIGYIHLGPQDPAYQETRILRKCDRFLRGLLARCVLLVSRWEWSLADDRVIVQLCEVFRSRQFGSLTDELPNFPLFITDPDKDDIEQYDRYDRHDAFDLFLKLVKKASIDIRGELPEAEGMKQIKKLLATVLPVGNAQYTRTNPPMDGELCQLYNRYASVLVGFSIDPNDKTMRSRVSQAQRYSDFGRADWRSRVANIRAMMYFTKAIIRERLDLSEVVEWLKAISATLLSEYCQLEALSRKEVADIRIKGQLKQTSTTIRTTLSSVRIVLETWKEDTSLQGVYPDPGFLQPDWLAQAFNTSLIDDPCTGEQFLNLIQAFLLARRIALPPTSQPPFGPLVESQDEFGDFDLDLNDPTVIAMMEGGGMPCPHTEAPDKTVALTIQDVVSPAIHKLVNRCISSVEREVDEQYAKLDRWIDCWAGCGHVLVQNKLKDWSHYFELGPESWARIINVNGRRRVGLRFMFVILELDPMSYKSFRDRFIDIWFQSVVAVNYTIEHMFTSRLFSLDGFRHPLFRNLPIEQQDGHLEVKISAEDLIKKRTLLIQKVVDNLASNIELAHTNQDNTLRLQNETGRSHILSMLLSMQDRFHSLSYDTVERAEYGGFCAMVIQHIQRTHVLQGIEDSAVLVWCNELVRDINGAISVEDDIIQ